MKKRKLIILAITIIAAALLLEGFILKYVNDKSSDRTSKVLLDRVITVLDKNDESEEALIKSLKDDYIVRAKAVSYIIDVLTFIVTVSMIDFFLSAFLSQRISFQSFRDGFRRMTLYPSGISIANFSLASFPAWSLSRHRKTEVI